MMRDYLVAMLALPLLFLVWVVVQWITRQYQGADLPVNTAVAVHARNRNSDVNLRRTD
ncbi:hypothetical protein [Solemya velum gill symbiont]|uniref:hypothetical protein n=1 Tax=Solemya velum gill symbiont TaxID=2340 RepID=UPI0015C3F598|nr:hypothetical protein [Solemya velum gill symbiont]